MLRHGMAPTTNIFPPPPPMGTGNGRERNQYMVCHPVAVHHMLWLDIPCAMVYCAHAMQPLDPILHPRYLDVLDGHIAVPSDVRRQLTSLLAARAAADESAIDAIDRQIVAIAYYYAIDPTDIARRVIQTWRLPRRVLDVDQAALVFAALAEAGWPIWGNGAPDYPDIDDWPALDAAPVRGPERHVVLWDAAHYWAEYATQDHTYVSVGGNCPRPVQYDMPGGMWPGQYAALTFGPAHADTKERRYMRAHTRMLLRVRRPA